jgi:hypothetical protein
VRVRGLQQLETNLSSVMDSTFCIAMTPESHIARQQKTDSCGPQGVKCGVISSANVTPVPTIVYPIPMSENGLLFN